jgi:hypothetical protein
VGETHGPHARSEFPGPRQGWRRERMRARDLGGERREDVRERESGLSAEREGGEGKRDMMGERDSRDEREPARARIGAARRRKSRERCGEAAGRTDPTPTAGLRRGVWGTRWGFRARDGHVLCLFPLPPRPPPRSLGSIDTCAGPAPAVNIFLMSSRGLKPARSALQGGLSPADVSGGGGSRRPREGGTNLSLRGTRAGDFLLKFKRKTGFHSAPKNVFLRGQWASFCASEGLRGGRGGDPCALAPPGRLAPCSTRTGSPSAGAGAGNLGSRPSVRSAEARCSDPCGHDANESALRAGLRPALGVSRVRMPGPKGCRLMPREEAGWVSGLGPQSRCPLRSALRGATSRN